MEHGAGRHRSVFFLVWHQGMSVSYCAKSQFQVIIKAEHLFSELNGWMILRSKAAE